MLTHDITIQFKLPENAQVALEGIRRLGFPIEEEEVIEIEGNFSVRISINPHKTCGIHHPMSLIHRLGLNPSAKSIARS